MFDGGPDRIPVMTNPPGAYVYLNGTPVGQTPMELSLHRGSEAYIQIYLPGFAPVQMVREKSFNFWFIGSCILFPLLVPPIVDLITGDYKKFEEGAIAIGLTPLAAPPPQFYQQQQPYPGPPTIRPEAEPYRPAPIQVQPATPTSQPPVVQPPAAPPPPKP